MAQLPFGLGVVFPQPVTNQAAIPIAGQTTQGQILQDIMSQLPKDFFGPEAKEKDWYEKAYKYQLIRDLYENDPRVIEQRSRIYEGTMNRIADSAQQRAMQGHLFKGFMDLPRKWQDAMAQKFTFAEPTFELIREGTQNRPGQVARQYNFLA